MVSALKTHRTGQSPMDKNDDTVKVDALQKPLVEEEEFNSGQMLAGKYKIISRLGKGGMGTVYRVQQVFLSKEFALKRLDARTVSDKSLQRFQLEAKAASSIDHPNIVQVHDFGLLDDEQPYFVMDLVDGITLADHLKIHGPMPLEEVPALFSQVCFGLLAAHERGVVHRDIKPGNIMLVNGAPFTAQGSVKIVDFGIAKLTNHESGEIQALTRTGEIFGSPLYMSPEQCSGGEVDQRSDIYSLGCVLFEMLTGTAPYMGQNALSTMMLHQSGPVPTLKVASLGKTFPEALEQIVAKMLCKSPDLRYQNVGVVANDLASVLNVSEMNSYSQASNQVQPRSAWLWYSGLATLLTGISAITFLFWFDATHTPVVAPQRSLIAGGANGGTAGNSSANRRMSNAAESSQDEQLAELIRDNPRWVAELTSLDLGHIRSGEGSTIALTNVTDTSLKQIKLLKNLKALVLRNCDKITSEGIKEIRYLDLETLSLEGTSIDDKAIVALRDMDSLVNLDLKETAVTDKCCADLAQLKRLKVLNIAKTLIGADGLKALSALKSFDSLDLTRDKISGGIYYLAGTSIKSLNLRGTQLTSDDLKQLRRIKSLRSLNLSGTETTNNDLHVLSALTDLDHLTVLDCKNLTRDALANLQVTLSHCLIEPIVVPKVPEPKVYAGDNLLKNGGFEEAVVDPFQDCKVGEKKIPHWTVVRGSVGLIGNLWAAKEGSGSLELNGSTSGAVAQTFTTNIGSDYVVQFWITPSPDLPAPQRMEVSVAGQSKVFENARASLQTRQNMLWKEESLPFKARSASTVLSLASLSRGPCGFCVDSVSVHPLKRH